MNQIHTSSRTHSHLLSQIFLLLFFFTVLCLPKIVFSGASNGLLLWFQIILPTLFPFLLLSNVLLSTGTIHLLTTLLKHPCSALFNISEQGSFVVLIGFLCGYPMGAKLAADFYTQGQISKNEAQYLLSLCNNPSPAFLLSFAVWNTFHDKALLYPSLIILFLSSLLVSLFTRKKYQRSNEKKLLNTMTTKICSKPSILLFQALDNAIMDSFQTLLKIGGYVILFSVLLELLKNVPAHGAHWFSLLSLLEVSNGVQMLGQMSLPFPLKYAALMSLCAFGGSCCLAQTKCMLQGTDLSFSNYIKEKLAVALTTSLLAYLYVIQFYYCIPPS